MSFSPTVTFIQVMCHNLPRLRQKRLIMATDSSSFLESIHAAVLNIGIQYQ